MKFLGHLAGICIFSAIVFFVINLIEQYTGILVDNLGYQWIISTIIGAFLWFGRSDLANAVTIGSMID